jgi:hypothetical protein
MSDLEQRKFTYDEVQVAIMIWEAMLQHREDLPELDRHWENHGTASMRDEVPALIDPIQKLWDDMSDDDTDLMAPFDWELVPWALEQVWTHGGGGVPTDIKQRLDDELAVRRGRHAVLHGV